MRYYIVSFDRRPTSQYAEFHSDFVAHSGIRRWCHFIKSSYILGTEMRASDVSTHFRTTAKKYGLPTRHIVLSVSLRDRAGWMPSGAWDWIRKQLEE